MQRLYMRFSMIYLLLLLVCTHAQAQGLDPNQLFKAVKGTLEQQVAQLQTEMLPIYKENIKEVKPFHYEVKKTFVDQQFLVMMPLLRQIRLVPTFENEHNTEKSKETQGFKLFGIKKNTLFDVLGVQNKDIIYRVNGERFTNYAQGAKLVEKAKKKDLVEIDIKREGKLLKLSYRIMP